MFNKKNKSESLETPKDEFPPTLNVPDPTASKLDLGIFGTALAMSHASSAHGSCSKAVPYSASVSMSYADYIQMQNLFGKLEKFLDAQTEKPYKTNLDIIKSFNSKQLALFVIRDVKKILSGTDSAVEELEAWLNEAPTLPE